MTSHDLSLRRVRSQIMNLHSTLVTTQIAPCLFEGSGRLPFVEYTDPQRMKVYRSLVDSRKRTTRLASFDAMATGRVAGPPSNLSHSSEYYWQSGQCRIQSPRLLLDVWRSEAHTNQEKCVGCLPFLISILLVIAFMPVTMSSWSPSGVASQSRIETI